MGNGTTDLLTLCKDVPREVIALDLSKCQGGNENHAKTADGNEQHGRWQKWLKVYSQEDASWASQAEQKSKKIIAKSSSNDRKHNARYGVGKRGKVWRKPAVSRVKVVREKMKVSKKPARSSLAMKR